MARVIGFLAILVGSLLVVGFVASWLFFRFRRHNAERCGRMAASQVGLAARPEADAGVALWQGEPIGQPVIVATHSWGTLDATGARFTFYGTPMVAVAAPFPRPLRPAFILSTASGARSAITTGDLEFDRHFRIDCLDAAPILALFATEEIKGHVRRLLGPSTFWSGSGRVVEITQHGVIVRETMPRARITQSLASDVLAAALALRTRATFRLVPDVMN